MRFPPSFLDDIRARVTISSVVGRRVAWDRRKTNAGKGDYWACCPFHAEKTPSFHVEDHKGRYHCFGCKASGDIFTFLVEKEGLSFPESVERLAGDAGLPMPVVSEDEVKRGELRAGLYEVMELAARYFEDELQSARGARARGYLSDRQISPAIQVEFRLGFATESRSALRSFLAQKGVSVEQMAEAGLVISGDDVPVAYDRFRDRVMFPIRDPRGKVVGFGGRALGSDALAKYLNSPETPLFHKGHLLYNLDKARASAYETGSVIAVEGYIDAIAMHRAGFPNVVAPLGTALTSEQLSLLWRMAAEPVLCFDGDQAGVKAAHRALDLALPLLKPGYSLKFALLPEGQDPDDLLRTGGASEVKTVIDAAMPLSEMLWRRALADNDRATPERKASFENDLRTQIVAIGDETVRRHYLAEMKDRLGRLFQSEPRGRGRQPRKPQAFQARGPGKSPFRAWDMHLPPSLELKSKQNAAGAPAGSGLREAQIVLAFLIHPGLLHEFLDEFADLELNSRDLDSLRTQIIDVAALEPALDGAGLRGHLLKRGLASLLDRIELQAGRLNQWFLRSGAAHIDARTGLSQMMALHRKTITLSSALKVAEAALAADPTEENLEALNAIREQLSSHAGAEAMIHGFGSASGRPADAIT